MSYCDNKNYLTCKVSFGKKIIFEFIKMVSIVAFMCVDQINSFADNESLKNIFI